jgi:hypothetical protein
MCSQKPVLDCITNQLYLFHILILHVYVSRQSFLIVYHHSEYACFSPAVVSVLVDKVYKNFSFIMYSPEWCDLPNTRNIPFRLVMNLLITAAPFFLLVLCSSGKLGHRRYLRNAGSMGRVFAWRGCMNLLLLSVQHATYRDCASYECSSGRNICDWHLVPQNRYQPHTLCLSFVCSFSHFLTLHVSVYQN